MQSNIAGQRSRAFSANGATNCPSRVAICLAEDRRSEEPPLKLAILSAREQNPDAAIIVFIPDPSDGMVHWISNQTNVELRRHKPGGATGWNVKPFALLELLAEGWDLAWWIDSDIAVLKNLHAQFGAVEETRLLVTEEAAFGRYWDRGMRAESWGFHVGRHFGFTLNTGVLRVAPEHKPLLQAWSKLLSGRKYLEAQRMPLFDRPFHLLGDQDVLTALLCSSEFSEVPIHVLRRGSDIVQYFGPTGFSVRERLMDFRKGSLSFIHSQGFKPWRNERRPANVSRAKHYFNQLLIDTSPHSMVANSLSLRMDDACTWALPRTRVGRLLRQLGMGNRALTGLPLAMFADVYRYLISVTRMNAHKNDL